MFEPTQSDFPLLTLVSPRWQFLETVGSTNQFLAAYWDEFEDFGLVLTLNQTAGRGRRGREWLSVPGETLAFSILVPQRASQMETGLLPLIAGTCVLDSLREAGVLNAEMKWPNDILVEGRKIAGILCEVISPTNVSVGVGINLDSTAPSLPRDFVISLSECGLVVEEVVDSILARIVELLRVRYANGVAGIEDSVWEEFFASRLGTLDRRVHIFEDNDIEWYGRAVGLDRGGHLLVLPDGGEGTRALAAGDVLHVRG